MSVQPIALQLGDSSSVLIERYCQGHCELLLLCENEWVGFGDGYLCSECGDGSHLLNKRYDELESLRVFLPISAAEESHSETCVSLNKHGAVVPELTAIYPSTTSTATTSASTMTIPFVPTAFVTVALSPVVDIDRESLIDSRDTSASTEHIFASRSESIIPPQLSWWKRLANFLWFYLQSSLAMQVIFLILLGFIVACLATFAGYVAFQSVPVRLAVERSVHRGGFLVWLTLTIALTCMAVFVSHNRFDQMDSLGIWMSGTSVARFCLAGFTSCRYWFCCNPFVDCLSDMYNFGVDDSVSNNLTADTPDDGEPRSVFGTGLPEVRAVLSGGAVHEVLSFRLLLVRFAALVIAMCAGLIVGPEGPFVLISATISHLLSMLRPFRALAANAYGRQQLLSTAAAVGIAGVFGSPFGGLLFSIEVTSTYYGMHSYFSSFLAAFSASLTFLLLWNGAFSRVLLASFLQTSFTEVLDPSLYHLVYFALLGVLCALVGLALQKMQTAMMSLRMRIGRKQAGVCALDCDDDSDEYFQATAVAHGTRPVEESPDRYHNMYSDGPTPRVNSLRRVLTMCGCDRFLGSPYAYAGLVALLVATFSYPYFIGDFMAETGISILRDLWSHDSLGVAGATHDWLSGAGLYSNLLYFIAYRLVFTAACLTLPIPCGLMLPSMVIGAGLGRFIGELLGLGAVSYSAGVFAVAGAAGVCASVTQSISIIIIIFEVTGQLYFIAPLITTVVVSVLISKRLTTSIYQQLLEQQPHLAASFLPPLPRWAAKGLVRDIMATKIVALPEQCNLAAINLMLQVYTQELVFPVFLLGVVSRPLLEQMLTAFISERHPEQSNVSERHRRLQSMRQRINLGTPARTPAILSTSGSTGNDGLLNAASMNAGLRFDLSVFNEELVRENRSIPFVSVPVRLLSSSTLVDTHMMFISLQMQQCYVTDLGKLIGVVTRRSLCALLQVTDPLRKSLMHDAGDLTDRAHLREHAQSNSHYSGDNAVVDAASWQLSSSIRATQTHDSSPEMLPAVSESELCLVDTQQLQRKVVGGSETFGPAN